MDIKNKLKTCLEDLKNIKREYQYPKWSYLERQALTQTNQRKKGETNFGRFNDLASIDARSFEREHSKFLESVESLQLCTERYPYQCDVNQRDIREKVWFGHVGLTSKVQYDQGFLEIDKKHQQLVKSLSSPQFSNSEPLTTTFKPEELPRVTFLRTYEVASKEAHSYNAKVGRVLSLIFLLGKKKVKLTRKEKSIFSLLLVDAIRPIAIYIESIANRYRTRLESAVLEKRSALQFIVDDYHLIDDYIIHNSIKILDRVIEEWRDFSDSDEGETDTETTSKFMPETHVWWSR